MRWFKLHSTTNISLQSGFTFIELAITLGILTLLLGLATVNVASFKQTTTQSTVTQQLLADFRSQQFKAMVGDTEGRSSTDSYGIYFGTNSYTLFHGTTYNAADSANYTVTLDPQFQFSPSGTTVIFSHPTGNVSSYNPSQNSIVFQDTSTNTQKTLIFNQYGVPVSFN